MTIIHWQGRDREQVNLVHTFSLRLMGLIWYLWEDIKSQCDFMYLKKKMVWIYYEQCIGTKWAHTIWISLLRQMKPCGMRNYTWNKGKVLPKFCEIPQLMTCKVTTSCEKPSMSVKKQQLSYFRNTVVFHLKMHLYFDKSMVSDLTYHVFCYILFILS